MRLLRHWQLHESIMKTLTGTLLLILLVTSAMAQIIDHKRLVDWSRAGIAQSEVTFKKQAVLRATSFGLKADGITDDTEALKKAIRTASGQKAIVQLPAGTILLTQSISLPSHVGLWGKSASETHLVFNTDNRAADGISINGKAPKRFLALKTAPKKGSKTLILKEKPDFTEGDCLELRQKNGSWDVKPRDWAQYSVGQLLQVTKVEGNQVFLAEEIRIDYDLNLAPEVGKYIPAEHISIRKLSIERKNLPNSGLNYNIYLKHAKNVWIQGIEGKKSIGSHIQVEQSQHIEVAGSYFHHAFDYSGSGTKGYGVCLSVHSSDCLIIDNVFRHLRHSMMVKQGANGNVIAYNYAIEPNRAGFMSTFSGDISLHGHYPFANLIEGNVVQNIIIDKYWGASGPDHTFLRNRTELYGIIYTASSAGYGHNLLGNEITNKGWFLGNLTVSGKDHISKCNQVKKATSCTEQVPKSYLFDQKPDFWTISDKYPSIGNGFNTGVIPAQKRYKEGAPVGKD